MEDIKICALIRQTWYEAARKNLRDAERLALYEACFNYQFYDKEPTPENVPGAAVIALFDIIRPILDEDKQKARNIIERNRLNGKRGGRPPKDYSKQQNATESEKPKETQKNPAVNLGQQYTIYNNTTQQNTTYFSVYGDEKTKTQTKNLIVFLFFSYGAPNAIKEASKFWNYYEARGWKLPNGQEIQNLVALAKTWRIEGEDLQLRNSRKYYCKLLELLIEDGDKFRFELVADFQSCKVQQDAEKIILTFYGQRMPDYLEQNCIDQIQIWAAQNLPKGWALDYNIIPVIE